MTADKVHALLDYDPQTGVLRWKRRNPDPKNWNKRFAGKIAGARYPIGGREYICVSLNNRTFSAHRIIWLIMTGQFPPRKLQIDHVNGDGKDNRWCNLRLATPPQNSANRCLPKNSTSQLKGAWFHKPSGMWLAGIKKNGKRTHLGTFTDAHSAHAAYCEAAQQMYGEFWRAA